MKLRPDDGGDRVWRIVYLTHQGVQLISVYSWARPAIFVAGKGVGECYFFCIFTCMPLFPIPLISSNIAFLFSLWEMTWNDSQGLMCRLILTQTSDETATG